MSSITLTRRSSRGASQDALLPTYCSPATKQTSSSRCALVAVLGLLAIGAVVTLCLRSDDVATANISGINVDVASGKAARALHGVATVVEGAPGPIHSPAAACRDLNKDCKAWAAAGECSSNRNYMSHMCPVSCLRCDTFSASKTEQLKHVAVSRAVASLQGADKHEECNAWAKAGECGLNPKYMLSECQHACAALS